MSFSTYLGNKVLDKIFSGTDFTAPSNVYVSLHTADPGLTGASECSGGSYARVAVVQGGFGTAVSKAVDNDSSITFPSLSADIGTATHWGLFDASSSGNFLMGGELSGSVSLTSGNVYEFVAGALDITA